MKSQLVAFVRGTEGQDLIEYALLAATIALGVIGAMTGVRAALNDMFNTIAGSLGGGS